jgi:hypothetical protein
MDPSVAIWHEVHGMALEAAHVVGIDDVEESSPEIVEKGPSGSRLAVQRCGTHVLEQQP